MKIFIKNLTSLREMVPDIISLSNGIKIWVFDGTLGSGKTAIINALCKFLEIEDNVKSPTYSIVNEYKIVNSDKLIYHFDFYRIKDIKEAIDIGFDEYIYSGNYCFIEWGSNVYDLLSECFFLIKILVRADGTRVLDISHKNAKL